MMNDSSLSPVSLSRNPELAILSVLEETLHATVVALRAANPELCEDEQWCDCDYHSEHDAYAMAIFYQSHALENTIRSYTRSLGRCRQRPAAEFNDMPF